MENKCTACTKVCDSSKLFFPLTCGCLLPFAVLNPRPDKTGIAVKSMKESICALCCTPLFFIVEYGAAIREGVSFEAYSEVEKFVASLNPKATRFCGFCEECLPSVRYACPFCSIEVNGRGYMCSLNDLQQYQGFSQFPTREEMRQNPLPPDEKKELGNKMATFLTEILHDHLDRGLNSFKFQKKASNSEICV